MSTKWQRFNQRQIEAQLGPEVVATAKAQARETVRLTRNVFEERLGPRAIVTAKYGPVPIPVWADGAPIEAKPLEPSVVPHCWQIYWFALPGTPLPSGAEHPNVFVRGSTPDGVSVAWLMESRAEAEEVLALVVGRKVTLPEQQKGAPS